MQTKHLVPYTIPTLYLEQEALKPLYIDHSVSLREMKEEVEHSFNSLKKFYGKFATKWFVQILQLCWIPFWQIESINVAKCLILPVQQINFVIDIYKMVPTIPIPI